jgi:hypothetical protein
MWQATWWPADPIDVNLGASVEQTVSANGQRV